MIELVVIIAVGSLVVSFYKYRRWATTIGSKRQRIINNKARLSAPHENYCVLDNAQHLGDRPRDPVSTRHVYRLNEDGSFADTCERRPFQGGLFGALVPLPAGKVWADYDFDHPRDRLPMKVTDYLGERIEIDTRLPLESEAIALLIERHSQAISE